ncbi:hypothetical protein TD95_001702, partial [Thielaviopsis punctulata]
MRQRVTFVHPPEAAIDPDAITVKSHSLSAPDLSSAVREDRFTLGPADIPAVPAEILDRYQELHIRWAGADSYQTLEPFSSRVPPGLHVFFTPLQDPEVDTKTPSTADIPGLCKFVSSMFGSLNCSNPESFVQLPTERFPSSPAFQYYEPLESLETFSNYIKSYLCGPADTACENIDSVQDVSSLDISYDSISRSVKVTALSPLNKQPVSITAPSKGDHHRTEVGILTPGAPPNMKEGDIGMSGLLTVLKESKKPSPVLFSFPSRHKESKTHFSAKFLAPTGLHPTWQLKFSSSNSPLSDAACSPHAYLTLPRSVFADRYQLADELFVQSKNISSLRFMSSPVDLEQPEYTTLSWGSTVLLELAPPTDGRDSEWTAEIPLHLRYLKPSASGYTTLQVPYPAVFWACNANEGMAFSTNPFDRTNLGYDSMFDPRTVFWHMSPEPAPGTLVLTSKITVPVLKMESSKWVELGTALAVGAGFLWVLWCLFAGVSAGKKAAAKAAKKDEKKA